MSSIDEVVDRFARWPSDAKAELIDIAREIDAEVQRGTYVATPEELAGIDRGLADVAQGKVVEMDEVERLLEKHRPK